MSRARGDAASVVVLRASFGLAIAAALAAGCGHAGSPPAAPLETPDLDASPRRPDLPGGPLAISVGGRDRTIVVHLPPDTEGPLPLVLNLHGSRFTAREQESFSGMDAAADAHGFVAAYPQAAIPSGAGFEWHVPGQPLLGGRPAPIDAPDDEAFIAAAVAALERRLDIDEKRVYAIGFSGGARMASHLGCDLAGTIAAVGAVGGLRFPSPCVGRRAVPVIALHGTADPVNPYEGRGTPTWTYGVEEAAEQWAAHDACGGPIVDSEPAHGVRLRKYTGCRDASAVELYSITAEGHEWPGGPAMPESVTGPLGPQSSAVDANALAWAFFAAHPMP